MKDPSWLFAVGFALVLGAIGVGIARAITETTPATPAPVPSSATSRGASVGEQCVQTLERCVISNQKCLDLLKETAGKADDYLQILEKASGKNLHRDAGK